MSDQSTILQSIWSKWRVLADADDLRKAQSLKEGDAGLGPAGLWMDESRMPVLLIPTTASATMPDYDESSSLEIRRAQKILDQRSGWFWLISCTDQELLNEFMAFCALVLFKISELGSSRKSIGLISI